MTNALAIAAATQTLRNVLTNAIAAASLDALGNGQPDVSTMPPDTLTDPNEVDRLNIYPWKVTHNPAFAADRLPSHTAKGARLSSPRLGLDIHMILTATGASALHAPILLGYGMQTLHEHPTLSKADIEAALRIGVDPANLNTPAERVLQNSDLADQIEQIRITPVRGEDEEVTKLWPALNTALRMSALYKVSLVLIEAQRTIEAGLPVREVALTAFPLRRPRITRILAQPGAVDAPTQATMTPQAGTRVSLLGSGLSAEDMELWIGGSQIDLALPTHAVAGDRISVVLPVTLRPGLHVARIDHFWSAAIAPNRRIRETSQGGAFVVAPTVVGAPVLAGATAAGLFNGTIDLTLSNAVNPDQMIRLYLVPVDPALGPPRGFTATALGAADTALSFTVDDVVAGDYTYALSVDGGESPAATLAIGGP